MITFDINIYIHLDSNSTCCIYIYEYDFALNKLFYISIACAEHIFEIAHIQIS